MNFLKLIGGILLSLLVGVVIVSRLAFEVLGASTSPDDFALLKQRMPEIAKFFFNAPWWVPAAILILAALTAAWLVWSGTRKTVSDALGATGWTEEQIRALIAVELQARAPAPSLDEHRVGTIFDDRFQPFFDLFRQYEPSLAKLDLEYKKAKATNIQASIEAAKYPLPTSLRRPPGWQTKTPLDFDLLPRLEGIGFSRNELKNVSVVRTFGTTRGVN